MWPFHFFLPASFAAVLHVLPCHTMPPTWFLCCFWALCLSGKLQACGIHNLPGLKVGSSTMMTSSKEPVWLQAGTMLRCWHQFRTLGLRRRQETSLQMMSLVIPWMFYDHWKQFKISLIFELVMILCPAQSRLKWGSLWWKSLCEPIMFMTHGLPRTITALATWLTQKGSEKGEWHRCLGIKP